MPSRRAYLLGSAALALAPAARVLAQQPGFARIAILYPGSVYTSDEKSLKAALQGYGYVEGRNIRFEVRHASGEYDKLSEHAFLLLRSKPDLVITQGTPAVIALSRATTRIPIVCMSMSDPVGLGMAASLARPGGNVTGLTNLSAELNAKRLALLKETLPGIRRVAYLVRPDNPAFTEIFGAVQASAQPLGVEIQRVAMRPPAELADAFSAMANARTEGLVIADDASYYMHMWSICQAALKRRLPSASTPAFARSGAMIGYGPTGREIVRRVASYVDRILKGANPGDLSIEQPTIFEFVVNTKTAAALGVRISQDTLLRADALIE